MKIWIKDNIEMIVIAISYFLGGIGIGAAINDAINRTRPKKQKNE